MDGFPVGRGPLGRPFVPRPAGGPRRMLRRQHARVLPLGFAEELHPAETAQDVQDNIKRDLKGHVDRIDSHLATQPPNVPSPNPTKALLEARVRTDREALHQLKRDRKRHREDTRLGYSLSGRRDELLLGLGAMYGVGVGNSDYGDLDAIPFDPTNLHPAHLAGIARDIQDSIRGHMLERAITRAREILAANQLDKAADDDHDGQGKEPDKDRSNTRNLLPRLFTGHLVDSKKRRSSDAPNSSDDDEYTHETKKARTSGVTICDDDGLDHMSPGRQRTLKWLGPVEFPDDELEELSRDNGTSTLRKSGLTSLLSGGKEPAFPVTFSDTPSPESSVSRRGRDDDHESLLSSLAPSAHGYGGSESPVLCDEHSVLGSAVAVPIKLLKPEIVRHLRITSAWPYSRYVEACMRLLHPTWKRVTSSQATQLVNRHGPIHLMDSGIPSTALNSNKINNINKINHAQNLPRRLVFMPCIGHHWTVALVDLQAQPNQFLLWDPHFGLDTAKVVFRLQPCVRQTDYYSCGVWAIFNADCLLRGEEPPTAIIETAESLWLGWASRLEGGGGATTEFQNSQRIEAQQPEQDRSTVNRFAPHFDFWKNEPAAARVTKIHLDWCNQCLVELKADDEVKRLGTQGERLEQMIAKYNQFNLTSEKVGDAQLDSDIDSFHGQLREKYELDLDSAIQQGTTEASRLIGIGNKLQQNKALREKLQGEYQPRKALLERQKECLERQIALRDEYSDLYEEGQE
ncbi:Uu.00g134710.m01.CDS01 [Anthostomella pinea]|uniref:Uu.00g134710.m01.CDS01 n=1 Tax=Anthostomella pinea TaxID=933095 RepID=A0AAI8YIF5_9PEZI|nr:Uu.00g134710.m01.CDS01 [Anthostomella pinea]